MDMDPSPPVSVVKRIVICGLMLLVLGGIGGFVALSATAPKMPHPWGEIRLMQYSTNATHGTMAHFRFRNLFEWPVFIEVGLEVSDGRHWEAARGYSMFVPIDKTVSSKGGQNFVVPVPFEAKEWRVLVRATKAEFKPGELRREKIKQWLDTHGAGFLGRSIKVDDPNGHILPGPLMKWEKPGRLPTPFYETSLRLPDEETTRTARASSQRR